MTLALELRDVRKRFGQTLALDGASLPIRPGTVHALLGENGAGKTTLMRVAAGLVTPDAGTLHVDGVERRFANAREALAAGVGMVHQHFTLVPAMTVAENVSLGGRGRWSRAEAIALVERVGAATGLRVPPAARVGDLAVGAQQRVEILKAVARDVRVLILDEPTAVLAPAEVEALLAWMRAFVTADGGRRSIVLITHKLREAAQVADDVTVLRAGRSVLHGAVAEHAADAIIRAMLGEGATDAPASPSPRVAGDPVIALRAVSRRTAGSHTALTDVTCTIHAGEVVGIAAVEGAGQHALLRVLAGRERVDAGEAIVPAGVSFIPEDRHHDAGVLDFSLVPNAALRGLGRARRLDWRAVRARTVELVQRFDVRTPGPDTPLRALSGGNQQRFIVGRELDPLPPAVVAVNPTRGLDLRATTAVHGALRDAAARGAAVVVYSSDLDEVLALADRVLVVHAGRVREVPVDRDAVGRAMLGVT